MTDLKTETVLSLLKTYLDNETAELLLMPIMHGIPVIVDGLQGPTGKTTLHHEFEKLGIEVTQRWMLDTPAMAFEPIPEVFKKVHPEHQADNKAFITISLNKFVGRFAEIYPYPSAAEEHNAQMQS